MTSPSPLHLAPSSDFPHLLASPLPTSNPPPPHLGFANQLEARELTLKAKEGDYEELLLMSHDANQSKEVAKLELAKFEALVSEERKLREKANAPPQTPPPPPHPPLFSLLFSLC